MRALILMQGIMAFPRHFPKVRQLVEKATGGKESGDVEDMFVGDVDVIREILILLIQLGWWKVVGRGSSSAGLDFSNDMQNVEHGQWHGGVDVSKRNSKHVNKNDGGKEDDAVLESCYGKANLA
ncbi:hypothetical protein TB1_034305 [Malus domestica]